MAITKVTRNLLSTGIDDQSNATAITIDSSENVGIGTTSPARPLHTEGVGVLFANTGGTHEILFGDNAYRYFSLYTPSSPDYMSIRTSTTDLLTVTSSGNVGIGTTSPTAVMHVEHTATNVKTSEFINKSGSLTGYTATMTDACYTSNTANYSFLTCLSGNGFAISDVEYYLRGDGNAYADIAWNSGGADYAEYFEWADGNSSSEDRRGWSVVLVNEKIRRATSDDDASKIIGVISGNPGVVGNSDIQGKWKGKYLTDDFGTHIRENVQAYHWETVDDDGQIISHNMHEDRVPEGVTVPTVEENDTFTSTTVDRKVDNPAYVEGQEYVQRENRPEWDTVGLMGKLRILKTEQKGTNWIKMRDISDTVEEWLVR